MNIKLLFCSLVLFICQSLGLCAHKIGSNAPNPNQYRVGVSLAGEYASIDLALHNRTSESLREEGTYSSNAHHSCSKLQLSPGVEFGLKIMDDYYLGVMVNYHYTRVATHIKNSLPYSYFMEHEFKLKSSTDALLKFGYRPKQKLTFYGLAGPSFASWEHNTRTVLLDGADLKIRRYSGFKKKTIGIGCGAGVEYIIRDKYALDFNYTFTMHRAQSVNYKTSYVGVNPTAPYFSDRVLDVQKSVRLTYSTIGLRFSYFFSF